MKIKIALRILRFIPGITVKITAVSNATKSANPTTGNPFIKAMTTLGTRTTKLNGVKYVRIVQKTEFRQ